MADVSDPNMVAEMDARIAAIGGWRGALLSHIRGLIREALPDIVETMKWKKPSNPAGVPVWERAGSDGKGGGILCTGETYKDKVKLTFGRGAQLADPAGLFNNGLGGNAFRAIDLKEGATVDPEAFKALIRAAAAERAGEGLGRETKIQ